MEVEVEVEVEVVMVVNKRGGGSGGGSDLPWDGRAEKKGQGMSCIGSGQGRVVSVVNERVELKRGEVVKLAVAKGGGSGSTGGSGGSDGKGGSNCSCGTKCS